MRYCLLLLPLLFIPAAEAALVTVHYTGTIHFSQFPSVPVGTTVSGTFTYDTSATGSLASTSIMSYPANGASAQMGTESAGSATGNALVTNDLDYTIYFRDEFLWTTSAPTFSTALAADVAGFNPIETYMQVSGSSTTTLPDTILTSLTPPNPFPFTTGSFSISALYDTGLGPVNAGAGAQVTFTTVPEPSSLAFAGLGLAFVVSRRYSGNS